MEWLILLGLALVGVCGTLAWQEADADPILVRLGGSVLAGVTGAAVLLGIALIGAAVVDVIF